MSQHHEPTQPPVPRADVATIRRNLRRWYRLHGRDLPWRAAGDAYRVWISEIMLQQTTVTAVAGFYERFLKRFPAIEVLAKADEEDVLRLWEGLGYYRRARNIHRTARMLVNEQGGRFPRTVDELMTLPGIGRYTAGAIASFAFDRPAPIVEANTLRLYCRLLGFEGDPRQAEGQRLLWSCAQQLVPPKNPGDFNQALIDLGAQVCTPVDPDCPRCPLRSVCRALSEGRVASIPQVKSPALITEVSEASVAVEKRGAYLLRRRGDHERWAGLWDFLRFELPAGATCDDRLTTAMQRELVSRIHEIGGVAVERPVPIHVLTHSVTRYRITLHCLKATFTSGRLKRSGQPLKWLKPTEFDRYPLSVTGRKLAKILSRQADESK